MLHVYLRSFGHIDSVNSERKMHLLHIRRDTLVLIVHWACYVGFYLTFLRRPNDAQIENDARWKSLKEVRWVQVFSYVTGRYTVGGSFLNSERHDVAQDLKSSQVYETFYELKVPHPTKTLLD